MRKLVLLLGIIMAGIFSAEAQHVRVGPEIGVNWSRFNVDDPVIDEDDFSMRAGLKIGGVVDIGFTRIFSFQPGLYFNQKGSRDRYSYNVVQGRTYVNNKIRVNYLEIPMNLQFKFGRPRRGQFFIGGGPYMAFAIGGEVDSKETLRYPNGNTAVIYDDDYDLEIGDDEADDDIKRTDAGVNFNLGFMAPQGFFIRGNSGIGLANIVPGGDEDYRWRNLSFSLTLGFLLGR